MHKMSADEARAFLLAGTRTGKLATVRADGRPHIAPIWFTMDGDAIMFTTWHTTVKAANMRRDPRISLCVDDEAPPFAYVLVDGTAQIIDDDLHALQHWATQIAARYMGADLADAYGRRNGVPGELLIRVTPAKVIGHARIAD